MKIETTEAFERDLKRLRKKHYDMKMLLHVLEHLENDEKYILRTKYKDHQLKGDKRGLRELHIENDWLLVYKVLHKEIIVLLLSTGSHDYVFR